MNRDSLLQLGESFLRNASSQSLPFSEQVQFLEGKGLTAEEIKNVVQSVSSPPKKDTWVWSMVYPLVIIGAGCTAYVISKALEEEHYEDKLDFTSEEEYEDGEDTDSRLILNASNFDDNERDLTDGSLNSVNSDSIDRHDNSNMGRLISVLEKQTTAIQQAIDLFTVSLATTSVLNEEESVSTPPISSMSPLSPKEEVVDTESKSTTAHVGVKSLEEILGDVQRIVDCMVQNCTESNGDDNVNDVENSFSSIKRGFSCIVMYIQKIIDNPKISRYHRLSIANSTFKSSVASLLNHEELLEALGFQRRGTFWEWQTSSVTSNTKNSATATSEEVKSSTIKELYFRAIQNSISILEGVSTPSPPKEHIVDSSVVNDQPVLSPSLVEKDRECEQNETTVPPENEIYSKSAAKDNTLKFEEIFKVATNGK